MTSCIHLPEPSSFVSSKPLKIITHPDGSHRPQPARSHILRPNPDQPIGLYEKKLPREGLRVTRTYQDTRWRDGLPFIWLGRRKQRGHGEGSSGLQFDVAEKKD